MDAQDVTLLLLIILIALLLFWGLGWTAIVGYAAGLTIALVAGLWLARTLRLGASR